MLLVDSCEKVIKSVLSIDMFPKSFKLDARSAQTVQCEWIRDEHQCSQAPYTWL